MLSGKMYRFRTDSAFLDRRYLEGYLRSPLAQAAIDRMKTGISDSGLNLTQKRFKGLSVPVAPVTEQHRIVEAIESYLTRLDDAVASLERVQRNLERYRASVLKAAVEGRLVSTEAELARQEGRSYEPADVLLKRILAERKARWIEDAAEKARAKGNADALLEAKKLAEKKYKEPAPPDTTDLPALPEGWCWTTMDQLTNSGPQNGIYVPKSRYGQGMPILRIDDYQVDSSRSSRELQKVELDSDESAKYALCERDIVINRVNSPSHLGKSMVVEPRHIPAVFESNMMRLSLAPGVIAAFVQAYLTSAEGKRRLTSNAKWAVNQASINQQDVGATPVPLPPIAEQRRIVEAVGEQLSRSHSITAVSQTSNVRAARLRQSILKWAFEGKLVEQDPNDEPASVLLERIKAEHQAASAKPKRKEKKGTT